MSDLHHEMYYDNAPGRASGVSRLQSQTQTLHRQSSRQFDAYGHLGSQMPTNMYAHPPTSATPTIDEQQARFDGARYNDRMNVATMQGNFGYDMPGLAGWNANTFGQNNTMAAIGGTTTRMKPIARGRTGLPPAWLDQPQPLPPVPAFPTLNNPSLVPSPRSDGLLPDDDELIPTAIVIKNIPFAVKKEQLVQLMTDLRLPLPYAFNYHFDNGVFRGLAFANFTTADETAAVIETMNHFELQGRKLRVEYKKMLPLAERERIEREKRERRGQLEEQHRPFQGLQSMHNQPSMSSLSSHMPTSSPSPLSAKGPKLDYDLNDPQVLQFYSQLLLFKEDGSRDSMSFPSTLTPQQRRIVHTLAHQMGLMHLSKGTGEQRQVHILRTNEMPNLSPPISQLSAQDSQRRALSRAATTDFADGRGSEVLSAGGLGRQSSGFLGFLESPGGGGGGGFVAGLGGAAPGGLLAGQNLRAAKSFADLRSYTPSPVPSTASFPATLSTNFSRFTDHGQGHAGYGGHGVNANHGHTLNSAGATSSNTGSLSAGAVGSGREDSIPSLTNGLNTMSFGPGFGPASAGSPRGLRGVMSWDRDHWDRDRDGGMLNNGSSGNLHNTNNNSGNSNGNSNNNCIASNPAISNLSNPGPIGGHRSASMNFDEHSQRFNSGSQLQHQHQHHSFSQPQQSSNASNGDGNVGNSSRAPGERTLGHQSSMPLRQPRGPPVPGVISAPSRASVSALSGPGSGSGLAGAGNGEGGRGSAFGRTGGGGSGGAVGSAVSSPMRTLGGHRSREGDEMTGGGDAGGVAGGERERQAGVEIVVE